MTCRPDPTDIKNVLIGFKENYKLDVLISLLLEEEHKVIYGNNLALERQCNKLGIKWIFYEIID